MNDEPILMAVDGNSLLHRSYHALAGTNLHDNYGRPSWAIKGMINQLCTAVERIRPDALVIGFDTPGSSVRRGRYAEYKGTRSEKKPDLVSQLELAQNMFTWAGFAVRAPEGLEADDVTATAAHLAGKHGWQAVIVTSDRDSFAHISDHTKVLRIINGGVDNSPLLDPAKLATMTGIRAGQYLDYAALRGDSSDNLPGVMGIGEKTAAKLLAAFDSMQEVWADIDAGGEKVASVVGKACRTKLAAEGAREAWARNVDIMAAVTDLDLGIDLAGRTGEGMLPLDGDRLTQACQVLNMTATIPLVLSALCGQTPRSTGRSDATRPAESAPVVIEADASVSASYEAGYPPPVEPTYDEPYEQAPALVPTASGLHPAAAVELF